MKLNKKVDGLNDLLEERLIGFEEPTQEDVAAIKEYEAAKKNGRLTLVPQTIVVYSFSQREKAYE